MLPYPAVIALHRLCHTSPLNRARTKNALFRFGGITEATLTLTRLFVSFYIIVCALSCILLFMLHAFLRIELMMMMMIQHQCRCALMQTVHALNPFGICR